MVARRRKIVVTAAALAAVAAGGLSGQGTTGATEALVVQATGQQLPASQNVQILSLLDLANVSGPIVTPAALMAGDVARTGDGNTAVVQQIGDFNAASLTQTGQRNIGVLYQEGSFNQILALQTGSDNRLGAWLYGSSNALDVQQLGDGNQYYLEYHGNGLDLTGANGIVQDGSNNLAIQTGTGPLVGIQQHGDGMEVRVENNPIVVPIGN